MRSKLTAAVLALAVSAAASAGPVKVDYTVSGSTNNWVLDFSVTNNISATGDMYVYIFGVSLPARDVVGTPVGWQWRPHMETFSTFRYGGSNIVYNNYWADGEVHIGDVQSGFKARVNSITAPTDVHWFAFAKDGIYTGSFADAFTSSDRTRWNPGFENVARVGPAETTVPEPGSLALFGLGMAGVALVRRRGKA